MYVRREGRGGRRWRRRSNGEGRGRSQGQSHALFAKMDKELEYLCRGLPHLDPTQPRLGGMAESQGGGRSRSF